MKARLEALEHATQRRGKPMTNGGQSVNVIECVWGGITLQPEKDLEDLQGIQLILHQVFLATYREAKKHDPETALWLLRSFMEDHPTAPGSNLFSKLVAVLEASLALKANSPKLAAPEQGDRNTLFLVAREAYRAGAEFIPALMGWLCPITQAMQGETPNWKILREPNGTKTRTFERISGGDDGLFFILFRLINRNLRNAIAHSDVQLDAADGQVSFRYVSGGSLQEERMSVFDFLFAVMMFSHLPTMYLSATSAILLLEFGRPEDKLKLPAITVETFYGVKLDKGA